MRVTAGEARTVAIGALATAGVPAEAARLQAEVLVEADLRGHHSHGLLRLPRILERISRGLAAPTAVGKHRWAAPAMLDVDGGDGLGPVVAMAALDRISVRARQLGMACAVIHSSNHLGMLAWYVESIARAGQIGIATTISEALVHPWGGRLAMQGTNPLAIGIPATPDPLVLDMSTGLISMGKVHDYALRGRRLEPGWALDASGEPTTSADAAKTGSIAPFGGAKGYALGLALEVLVGSLTPSALGTAVRGTLDSAHPCNKGDVFIVLQPASPGRVTPVSDYLGQVRQTPTAPSDTPVSVPGDGARRRREQALRKGIDVADPVWAQLRATAQSSQPDR
ncbi:MAG: dehydrogenase [Actinomycetia bacterium]|nr:dehydrogenase [Actinomycetes bacterium]